MKANRRILLWIAAISLLLFIVAGGYGAHYYLRVWQPRHLADRASEFLRKGDTRNAVLTARHVLEKHPDNVQATEVIADVSERVGLREAVQWRRRAAELQPGQGDAALRWATAAVRFGAAASAREALGKVPARDQQSAAFHSVSGQLALQSGQTADAQRHFAAALAMEPENALFIYNKALLALMIAQEVKDKAAARATLASLVEKDPVGAFALRALAREAIERGALAEALELADKLTRHKAADFNDRLMHLALARKLKAADAGEKLLAVQQEAAAQPELAANLIRWMRQERALSEARAWAETLPPEVAAAAPVLTELAGLYAEQQDWDKLSALASEGNWGESDYLRHAYRAFSMKHQPVATGLEAVWTSAVAEGGRQPGRLRRLYELVREWKWTEREEEVLLAATKAPSDQGWALNALYDRYKAAGDAVGMLRVVERLVQLEPKNSAAKNNLALLSMLVGQNLDRAFRLAREVYLEDRANPAFVSTYAYALLRQNQTESALETIRSLGDQQLRDPQTAAYYSIILAAHGDLPAAAEYKRLARGAQLFKEERELLDQVPEAEAAPAVQSAEPSLCRRFPDRSAVRAPTCV